MKEMMLKTRIAGSIADIPVSDWERVYPGAMEGYGFFKALEESRLEQFSFCYCLVQDGSETVGIAPLFFMDFSADMAVQGILRGISRTVKKFFPRAMKVRALFCGIPMGQGRIGLAGDKEKILECLCAGVEEAARQKKAAVVIFKDFGSSSADELQLLLKRGFLRSHSLPSTAMQISFDSFEGYLKTLSSSSREGFRRKFKKIDRDNPPINMEVAAGIDAATAADMHALYMQTALDANIEFEVLSADFFVSMSRNLPQEARFFLWRTEDRKLVAFAFCLVKGDYFLDYYLGFDYSVAYKYNLYLVRFRGLLEWCIVNKIKTYEIGQSSYEIKRRLGFKFIPLFVYAKPCSKLIAPLFKFHSKFLMFERFDPVFKQMRQKDALFCPAGGRDF